MKFYVDDELIDIDADTKPYGFGTEGQVFKIGDEIFKLYFYDMLDEGHGNKYYHHKDLTKLYPERIALPKRLIYSLDHNYMGYTAQYINGDVNDNYGITLLSGDIFIDMISLLVKDIKYLSDEKVLLADLKIPNTIFDKKNKALFLIDPGRYQSHPFDMIPSFDYEKQNMFQFNLLIGMLLKLDFGKYNPLGDEKKNEKLLAYIIDEVKKNNGSYLEFFKRVFERHENVNEYVKTLKRKIN